MLLKVGYLLQGASKKIREIINSTIILFSDTTNYSADTNVVSADNNSNI